MTDMRSKLSNISIILIGNGYTAHEILVPRICEISDPVSKLYWLLS